MTTISEFAAFEDSNPVHALTRSETYKTVESPHSLLAESSTDDMIEPKRPVDEQSSYSIPGYVNVNKNSSVHMTLGDHSRYDAVLAVSGASAVYNEPDHPSHGSMPSSYGSTAATLSDEETRLSYDILVNSVANAEFEAYDVPHRNGSQLGWEAVNYAVGSATELARWDKSIYTVAQPRPDVKHIIGWSASDYALEGVLDGMQAALQQPANNIYMTLEHPAASYDYIETEEFDDGQRPDAVTHEYAVATAVLHVTDELTYSSFDVPGGELLNTRDIQEPRYAV